MDRLETRRLVLREWEENDLDDLHRYARDAAVGESAGWKACESMEESGLMLDGFMRHQETWAVTLKDTGRAVGHIRLTPNPNKGRFRAKSVSYALDRDAWGQGYMTEALRAIIGYAFEKTDANMLTAFTYPENVRSGRVLEKCGFIYDGTLPGSIRRVDGRNCDAVCYMLLKQSE